MTEKLEELKHNLIGLAGKGLINLIFGSMRIQVIGFEAVQQLVESQKIIFACWHSRILMGSYLYQGWGAAIMVSQSKDGEIIARILSRQGHRIVRGSTSRGGARALAKMIRILKKDKCFGTVIPDGPRGPCCKVQPGVVTLAKKTGCPIVPISYSARKIKVFDSWDRFVLPYPFTKGTFIYGNPIFVPKGSTPKKEKELCVRLEKELNRITKQADNCYGHMVL
ncbi:MAG: lysophospholipid acyltransferase family protein [Pseudomonadota bacterium]